MDLNSYKNDFGEKYNRVTYEYFFEKKDPSLKAFIGFLAGVSFCFLSFFFLIPIVIDSFNGHLIGTIKGSSDQRTFITVIGLFFSVWTFMALGSLPISF